MLTYLTPDSYAVDHYLACFPDGVDVFRIACAAEQSVNMVTQ